MMMFDKKLSIHNHFKQLLFLAIVIFFLELFTQFFTKGIYPTFFLIPLALFTVFSIFSDNQWSKQTMIHRSSFFLTILGSLCLVFYGILLFKRNALRDIILLFAKFFFISAGFRESYFLNKKNNSLISKYYPYISFVTIFVYLTMLFAFYSYFKKYADLVNLTDTLIWMYIFFS